jgi:hypothetical protein
MKTAAVTEHRRRALAETTWRDDRHDTSNILAGGSLEECGVRPLFEDDGGF